MSANNKQRDSIVRKGAGRAFLRFLIGEVLLIVLCSVFYLFVLQGKVDLNIERPESTEVEVTLAPEEDEAAPEVTEVPTAEPTPEPTPEPTDEATAVPTIEPTAEPTPEVTPEPTATPIPAESFAALSAEPLPGLPTLVDPELKAGLRDLSVFNEAGQSAIVVRCYGYIQGADALSCDRYLLLINGDNGNVLFTTPVANGSGEADLTFEADEGENLDQAFVQTCINAAELPDGNYMLGIAVENESGLRWVWLDSSMFHFRVWNGTAAVSE